MALERGHCLDHALGARGIADAPAGHGVGLGYAVDHDRLRLDRIAKRSHAVVRFAIVDQLFIDFIADNIEALFHRQIGDGAKIALAPHAAVRVRRAVQNQRLGLFGHVGAHHIRGHDEIIFFVSVHHHRHAARHAHHFRIGKPARAGHDHFIAGIDDGAQRSKQHLLCAVGYDDFRRIVFKAVIAEEFIADLHAQIQRARDGGIARNARVDGEFARIVDVFGGAEIRLARAEGDHIQPLRAKLFGLRIDRQRDGRRNRQCAFGK